MNATQPIIVVAESSPSRPNGLLRPVNGLSSAAVVIGLVGGWFWWRTRSEPPTPGGPTGLALGIVGFVMMLGAQSLYTLRKRLRHFHRGRMSAWLQSHVFLGLVGAFLVLLHGSGKFHGLAGVAAGLLLVVVGGGFVGRYLYTAAPRTIDGVEIDARELTARFARTESRLRAAGVRISVADLAALGVGGEPPGPWGALGRPFLSWRQRNRVRRYVRRLPTSDRAAKAELRRLLVDRYQLQLDIRSVAATRRRLAWWHALHVPLSWVLFTLAAIHIAAAVRYSRG